MLAVGGFSTCTKKSIWNLWRVMWNLFKQPILRCLRPGDGRAERKVATGAQGEGDVKYGTSWVATQRTRVGGH